MLLIHMISCRVQRLVLVMFSVGIDLK